MHYICHLNVSSSWMNFLSSVHGSQNEIQSSIMLLLSPITLLAAATLLFAIHLIRRLTSPLSKIPGPTVSKFTSLVLKWKEIKALRTVYIHQLHQQYGPVVRIAPNEVSFTSWEALKEIYCSGGSGYDKTEFYDLFKIGDVLLQDHVHHVEQGRRMFLADSLIVNTTHLTWISMPNVKGFSPTVMLIATS